MINNPLDLFRQWYTAAREFSPLQHPGAVCVSTIDEYGFPDARFVDLKEVTDTGFVFCTHLQSVKGLAITNNPNIALTFWWDHLERQVRVVGQAEQISDAQADGFFQQRSRDAQLTTWTSQQSSPLDDVAALEQKLEATREQFAGTTIPRPANWSGYSVRPVRIEFLSFKVTRLHERLLFYKDGDIWQRQWLQP